MNPLIFSIMPPVAWLLNFAECLQPKAAEVKSKNYVSYFPIFQSENFRF